MTPDILDGLDVTIHIQDVPVDHRITRDLDGQWHAWISWTTASSSPWDDGPTGPDRAFADLVDAVAWVRDTVLPKLAAEKAEAEAAQAAVEQAARDARSARARALRAAKKAAQA